MNLRSLFVSEFAENFVVKSNGFHTTSISPSSILTLGHYTGGYITLEANAFGNVEGGQLWQIFDLGRSDFNEGALRLFIKAQFDKGNTSKYFINHDYNKAIPYSFEQPKPLKSHFMK